MYDLCGRGEIIHHRVGCAIHLFDGDQTMGFHQTGNFGPRLQFQFRGSLLGNLSPNNLSDIHRYKNGLLDRDHLADLSPQAVPYTQSGNLLPGDDDIGRRKLDERGQGRVAVARWQL